jgi:hypothetical protein
MNQIFKNAFYGLILLTVLALISGTISIKIYKNRNTKLFNSNVTISCSNYNQSVCLNTCLCGWCNDTCMPALFYDREKMNPNCMGTSWLINGTYDNAFCKLDENTYSFFRGAICFTAFSVGIILITIPIIISCHDKKKYEYERLE